MSDIHFSHDCVGPRIPWSSPLERELFEIYEEQNKMIRDTLYNMLKEDIRKRDNEIRKMFKIPTDLTEFLKEVGKDQIYNLIQEGYIRLDDYFYQEVNGVKVKITIFDIYNGQVGCHIMNQETITTKMEIQRLDMLSLNFRSYQIPERNLIDIEELMIPYDITKVHLSRRRLKPNQKITLK